MRRRIAPVLGCMVLLGLVPAAATAEDPGPDEALAARLAAVVDSPSLKRARVAALVERVSDGAVLYAQSPDRAMTPASNVKILTAMAALDTFGPTHRFETAIRTDRAPDAAGTVGKLYVVGGGDPVMNSEDWWRLAADLRRVGLRRITGDLVLDDGAFDRERWHPGWGRTSSRAYHAPVGGLTANYGSFSVTVTPGEAVGDPVRVAIDPPIPYLSLLNQARTAPLGARQSLIVDRADDIDTERVTVQGAVVVGRPARTYYRSVLDPTRYAGAVLRMQLAANGIEVDGDVRVAAAPAGAVPFHVHEGRPLGEIVRLFVKFSNNAVAESLVKAMGRASGGGIGSWETGVPAMRRSLLGLGLDPEGFSLVDGSGLSYENKVTARTFVHALRLAGSSFRFGPELLAALPIAHADGTLEKRAAEAAFGVRAKTGLLNRVTTLSGYAQQSRGGERVRFSILVNGYRVADDAAMRAVDAFVAELVRTPVPAGPRVSSNP